MIGRPGPITRGETFDPIPRVIHQTWKTEDVPAAWKDFQQSWRDAHPGWAYKLWTDADNRRLIAERYVWFLSTYDAFPREIQRVDAAKYFILHSEGGVYADLDAQCVQPLDPITARGGLIAGRTRDGVIEGAVLASPPGHPFWPIVFARLQAPSWSARALRGTFDSAYVLFSTGPQMLRRAMREYLRTLSRQTPPRAAVTICDPATFSSRSWLARYQPFETSTTFVRHHYSDSWLRPGEERLLRWFTLRTLRWGVAILGLTAVLLGWWLS